MRIFLRHIQIIRQTQGFWNTGRPRPLNLITCYDNNRGGCLAIWLRFLGHGSDIQVHQLLQTHFFINRRTGKICRGRGGCRRHLIRQAYLGIRCREGHSHQPDKRNYEQTNRTFNKFQPSEMALACNKTFHKQYPPVKKFAGLNRKITGDLMGRIAF